MFHRNVKMNIKYYVFMLKSIEVIFNEQMILKEKD
jgi:hypothetical protein